MIPDIMTTVASTISPALCASFDFNLPCIATSCTGRIVQGQCPQIRRPEPVEEGPQVWEKLEKEPRCGPGTNSGKAGKGYRFLHPGFVQARAAGGQDPLYGFTNLDVRSRRARCQPE